ncbi:MAG: type IV secretory system conjugative DNA transfer family protein [Bacteroidetes bacterium]|nr:type IV secretory system conjugative DNA transfer family protein [Bacteroidota bacterium]
MNNQFDIDKPILGFACESGRTDWTMRSSFAATLIVGGTGSGKSTGSCRTIAKRMLRNNYGGLVLTVKETDVQDWRAYCLEEGRENDLVIIEPGGQYYFDTLDYISTCDTRANYANNIFKSLKEVIKANEQRAAARGDDVFWEQANDMFLKNIISLCLLAHGKVTLQLLFEIAQTAPRKNDMEGEPGENAFLIAFEAAKRNVRTLTEVWNKRQDQSWIDNASQKEYEFAVEMEVSEIRQLRMLRQFFYRSMFSLGEKTRAVIDFYFLGFVHSMLEEPIYSLFFKNRSNVKPEDCLDGKIILINLPVKIYDAAGQNSQQLFKYVWMKAMERRNIQENGRPVFLVEDEGQELLLPCQNKFMLTARSNRIASVFITQNLANIYDAIGGDKPEYKSQSLLGIYGTQIFHANSSVETNKYASELIGQAWMMEPSTGYQLGGKEAVSFSKNKKYTLQFMVRPEEIPQLKNGGPENDFKVEAYIHLQHTKFPSGFNHHKVTFLQNS